ncbi:MAG: tRNA uridine-5-carboxymethylaminomethyl(34) synthesis GTPase MnmE [Bacteroidetes bacterium]|nr:MAG: tRNA uridine-5-carboxymethylaminomethyl(34) synthesis GTPase MnmE [Bacteroidota bacterium]
MLNTVDLSDTIVALATPPGVGAIGIIRLSGKDAVNIVNEVFPGKDLTKEATHTIHFGTLRDGDRILDEVLVSLFIAPKSYTGENVVEVSCHGSEYILQKAMELFVKKGARPAEAGEFTMRAFLNGQMDLSQAEAVADLIASSSESSHNIAMQQMRGGFSHEIANLRQELIDFASLIELELDFSEEDVEFANRDALEKLVKKIRTLLKALIDSFRLGNVLKNGVNTVIAGRPNAGKSTLLNAMLKEERAIVSDIAGTTRDTIEEVFNIQGINYRLIDTAGIRDARDQIEAVGVEKTFEKVKQSAILIYVFDVIETSPEEVKADLEKLSTSGLIILGVANKMDLNPYTKAEHYTNDFLTEDHFIPVSAKNDMNLGLLKDKLYEAVVSGDLNTESTIVSNTRHYAALQKAYESLDAVLDNMDQGVTSDFIAMDIRQALHHLGTITGEVSADDLLGNIFGKFCIGK